MFKNALTACQLLIATALLAACGSETGGEAASKESRAAEGPSAQTSEQAAADEPGMPGVGNTQQEITAPTPAIATDRESTENNIDAPAAAQTPVPDSGDPCLLSVAVGDGIAYSVTELRVPASCAEVTVELTHTGRLPAAAMGHNWVLVPASELQSVAQAGASAGLGNDYLPSDDERIVAATRLIGGGETDRVTFPLSALEDGTDYMYVCTVPGHWMVMQGTLEISG